MARRGCARGNSMRKSRGSTCLAIHSLLAAAGWLGGDAGAETKIGSRAGPGFGADQIVPAIERLVLGYLELRSDDHETFLQSYRRLGAAPFKAVLYPAQQKAA